MTLISEINLSFSSNTKNVTLSVAQIPAHTHNVTATTNTTNVALPGGNYLAKGPDIYDVNTAGSATMANAISNAGGSVPHSNIQPYLAVNFILSLFGVFPSQT